MTGPRLTPYDLAQCESMLSGALNTPQHGIGFLIRTNNTAMQARAKLYEYRKQVARPEYTNLQIRFSPDDPDNDLWCIKNQPNNPSDPEQPESV